MMLAVDGGTRTLGWAVLHPKRCVVEALGVLIQEHDTTLDDTTCRARRGHRQAQELYAVINEHHVTTIAAEAVSLGGPPKARLAMAQALNFCWGVLTTLGALTGCELLEVRPKAWQGAIVPEAGGGKVDYSIVFEKLSAFVKWKGLAMIPKAHRNHAIDAAGVGLYAALRATEVTRIARRPS